MTTSINIRMDSELKKQFESFCKDVGLSMSAAVTVFAKKTVCENRIPFDVGILPNEKTIAAIEAAEKGESINGPFDSVEEMMEALNA